ncbi:reverse transcriptase domain-containing protein, partial [Tanacetum coccineum]
PKEANHSAGTQDNIDAGNSEMEAEFAQDYFVLPIWSSYTSTARAQKLKIQENEANDAAEALRKEFAQNTEDLLLQAGVARASSTNTVNTASTPVSTVSPSSGLSHTNLTYPDQDDSQIPALKDIYEEKGHFMVKEGIVLGHKISKIGIEVDKAKIDVIAKLPHPTTVKGIRSFLGHAGFYRRFIKDFSKISRPMTHLLEKNTPFIFSKECIQAFQTLKKKLTEAPIMIAPDWDQPFEIMCDASDYAIGAVLGQRIEKHFRPIHYASKTMTKAESNYTTTEKEMLVMVYAFKNSGHTSS